MSFSAEFKFPLEEDFVYIEEITEGPYQASEEFLEIACAVPTDNGRLRYVEYSEAQKQRARITSALYDNYPSLEVILGPRNHAKLGPEVVTPSNTFKRPGWHVDTFPGFKSLKIMASSTPTEIAQCDIEFHAKAIAPGISALSKSGPLASRGRSMNTAFVALTEMYGSDWLEIAGGLKEGSKEEVEGLKRFVRVSNLAIMQLMPCVALDLKEGETLHRSAPWHPSQPRRRVFGKVAS